MRKLFKRTTILAILLFCLNGCGQQQEYYKQNLNKIELESLLVKNDSFNSYVDLLYNTYIMTHSLGDDEIEKIQTLYSQLTSIKEIDNREREYFVNLLDQNKIDYEDFLILGNLEIVLKTNYIYSKDHLMEIVGSEFTNKVRAMSNAKVVSNWFFLSCKSVCIIRAAIYADAYYGEEGAFGNNPSYRAAVEAAYIVGCFEGCDY